MCGFICGGCFRDGKQEKSWRTISQPVNRVILTNAAIISTRNWNNPKTIFFLAANANWVQILFAYLNMKVKY